MNDWIDVAPTDEIAPGTVHTVDVDEVQVAVFNVDGELYAIEDQCTHDYFCLSEGELEGEEVVCPLHGARFDLRTGEATAPPAYEPVATYAVRIEDGRVQVRDERDD